MVAELSASNVTGDKMLPSLLKQTRRKINEISAYGAYDTKQCYETICIEREVPLIPSKKQFFGTEVIRII
ncbi:hypothetical protein [Candidatus Enterovibrio altilux]|uniref:hypothetical protein n=1 Tax=Candidatus Enterovibrio altilux TaxID=1927128 RepID=UPI003744AFC0